MRRLVLALLLALVLTSTARAGTTPKWTTYHAGPNHGRITTIEVKTRCLNAEDSAAHLTLKGYDGTTARYGCKRTGY